MDQDISHENNLHTLIGDVAGFIGSFGWLGAGLLASESSAEVVGGVVVRSPTGAAGSVARAARAAAGMGATPASLGCILPDGSNLLASAGAV